MNKAKIIDVTPDGIYFSNGSAITDFHDAQCCEYNYADFEQLEDLTKEVEFTFPLQFEEVEGAGFRFGNKPNKMFFIPCYSIQNGYYSSDVEILLDGKEVLIVAAELDLY